MKPFRVDNSTRINHDGTSFVIEEWKNLPNGPQAPGKWKPVSWFPGVSSLLRALFSRWVGQSQASFPEALGRAEANVRKLMREIERVEANDQDGGVA